MSLGGGLTKQALEHKALHGNTEYERALDSLFAQPGRALRIFDRRLSAAYNLPHRAQLLKAFLSSSRSARAYIVVHDTASLQRDCPRLFNVLRQFSSALQIYATEPPAKGACDPFAVVDNCHYVHRFHYDGPRGVLAINDAAGASGLLQRFEQIWEASTPAVSATKLGL